MKKTYCVVYNVPQTSYDVEIKATSAEEAVKKVKEVIPDAFNLEAWEIRKTLNEAN